MRRVSTSWRVIKAVLKEHAHSAYEALRPPAPLGKVAALEDLLGRRLPRGLVTSLRLHDGMRDRADLVDYMSLLSAERIGFWWRLGYRSQQQDGFGGNPETHTRKIKNDARWRAGWVPFMEDLGGDLMVIDLDPGPAGDRGQVFQWYNNGATAMRVAARSYPAWLDAVAEALSLRRFTLDELGSIRLRKRLT
jgi:cell wall assembly regulator SMI1